MLFWNDVKFNYFYFIVFIEYMKLGYLFLKINNV